MRMKGNVVEETGMGENAMKAGNDDLLGISEAAELLKVSKATIRRWTAGGYLKCSRIGPRNERRFAKSDLLSLLSSSEHARPSTAETPRPRTATALLDGSHFCIFCDDLQEEIDLLRAELNAAFDSGLSITVIDGPGRHGCLMDLLAHRGMQFDSAVKSGALRYISVEDSYLAGGNFNAQRAAAFVESILLGDVARGFDRSLFAGSSRWLSSSKDTGAFEELKKYEFLLNDIVARFPGSRILCPYAVHEVSADVAINAICAHPSVQIKSQIAPGLLESFAL